MSEDDKATKVVNLNKLKKSGEELNDFTIEFTKQKEISLDLDEGESLDSGPSELAQDWVFFDLKGNFFAQNSSALSKLANVSSTHTISSVGELSKTIKSLQKPVVFFYYNQAVNETNSLLKQLNEKFAHVKKVLLVEGGDESKFAKHQSTAAKAEVYGQWPLKGSELIDKLKKL